MSLDDPAGSLEIPLHLPPAVHERLAPVIDRAVARSTARGNKPAVSVRTERDDGRAVLVLAGPRGVAAADDPALIAAVIMAVASAYDRAGIPRNDSVGEH